jgi:uncharacterized NAD-dependent epimerase/dehydratase family protein
MAWERPRRINAKRESAQEVLVIGTGLAVHKRYSEIEAIATHDCPELTHCQPRRVAMLS